MKLKCVTEIFPYLFNAYPDAAIARVGERRWVDANPVVPVAFPSRFIFACPCDKGFDRGFLAADSKGS